MGILGAMELILRLSKSTTEDLSAYIGLGSENGRNSDGNSTEGEKRDVNRSLDEVAMNDETSKESDLSTSSGRLDVKV